MLILRRRTTTCDSPTVQIVQSHQVASFESDPRPPRIGVCVSFAEESCARKLPFPKHGGFIEDRQFFSLLHRRQNCQKNVYVGGNHFQAIGRRPFQDVRRPTPTGRQPSEAPVPAHRPYTLGGGPRGCIWEFAQPVGLHVLGGLGEDIRPGAVEALRASVGWPQCGVSICRSCGAVGFFKLGSSQKKDRKKKSVPPNLSPWSSVEKRVQWPLRPLRG